ncbi:hypothetical protein DPX16_6836 [Anabarilius grahami]|uniref:Uncharacterized protein n=1 Tax=Anabarilius grahami TaxID=495550 RepID=A0A3N0Y6P3_ANAGA|nr:hypothetical protein DPX16_6836 [Anabarilius grahami]
MMQRHTVASSNFPRKPTSTTRIVKHYYKLSIVNRAKVLVAGIVTILGAKFPSPCLLVIAMILNIVSGALAIAAVVLYSVDLAKGTYLYCNTDYYSSYDYPATPSPADMSRTEICMQYKHLILMIVGGLEIMIIVLSVLQLCVTISFCVLTGKALCKKDEDAKDPELYKQLLEDDTAVPLSLFGGLRTFLIHAMLQMNIMATNKKTEQVTLRKSINEMNEEMVKRKGEDKQTLIQKQPETCKVIRDAIKEREENSRGIQGPSREKYTKELTVEVEVEGTEKISMLDLLKGIKKECGEVIGCRRMGVEREGMEGQGDDEGRNNNIPEEQEKRTTEDVGEQGKDGVEDGERRDKMEWRDRAESISEEDDGEEQMEQSGESEKEEEKGGNDEEERGGDEEKKENVQELQESRSGIKREEGKREGLKEKIKRLSAKRKSEMDREQAEQTKEPRPGR